MNDLFELAEKGDLSILNHPSVDKIKDNWEKTPLHYLADLGKVEVLQHSSVNIVKDSYGWTPLHHLANQGKVEVLQHSSVDTVKDNRGSTPLHYLAWRGRVTKEHIKKLYPWYICKGEITKDTITEILNTPYSVRFIKS